LAANEVHVWRVALTAQAGPDEGPAYLLAPDERKKAALFRFDMDRRRYVAGRVGLRTLLGRLLDAPANELTFAYGPKDKPSLATNVDPPVEFNVSHSGELVLIALSRGRAVGVDVERIRPDVAATDIADRFFSENERNALAGLEPAVQCDAFFACWTRKEAYIKAQGDGLSLPLAAFDVTLVPDEQARLTGTRPDPAEASRWSLHDLPVGNGYKAALAIQGTDRQLKCWDWPLE
jgi:4'-phosphopantetheinyl transferase